MTEKLYLFNPFQIKDWDDDQIKDQVNALITKYDNGADTMYQLSMNVEILANINYLYGEKIARLTKKLALKKLDTDSKEAKQVYFSRKEWAKENTEKAPAMSYFEAKASEFVKEDREKQFEIQSDLTRFKYAYDSIENKMNAIKKKMESIKFEEFNQ